MGSTLRHMGSGGSGALAKACNEILVAGTVTAVSEAMLLARGGGLDPSVMLELLRAGLADSEVLWCAKGHKWIDGDFTGGGSAQNQPDVRIFSFLVPTGRTLGVPRDLG
jgi:3-hydroxyisobutyrate dehydrogenase-like beta-hydroxyacid dehydrogenase